MKARIITTVLLATIMVAGTVYAGGIFNTKKECEDAVLSGTAEFYVPRYLGSRDKNKTEVYSPIEDVACVLMDTVARRKWVALDEGTEFWFREKPDGNLEVVPYSLKACGNRVYSISYPRLKVKAVIPVAETPAEEDSQPSTAFDPESCGSGTEAVWDREARRYECRAIAAASVSVAVVTQYQLGGACKLSDDTPGLVTQVFPNGNFQCEEVFLEEVPSRGKAFAQYLVCTTAGALVGYYNGGVYSAISGGAGGAGGTYLGRELGGEDWGWVGCVTGPAAGLIKFGGNHHSTPTRPSGGGTGIGDISPSGGGTGIGDLVSGGGGGGIN